MAQAELTLYQVAKQMVLSEEKMDTIAANRAILSVAEQLQGGYYMLICPDLRQYVVFNISYKADDQTILQNLSEVLFNRGQLLMLDDDNADKNIWEFWVQDKYTGEPYMYQLTPYEVIEVI